MSKAALKAAKSAIDVKDWVKAESKSRDTLSFDPENYYANIFLGLSLFNLQKYDESEQAYRRALEIEADERRRKERKERTEAWQGLVNLYESQKQVDKYMDTAVHLAEIFRDQDDRFKCQTVIDKVIPFVQQHGTKSQYKASLQIILPGSTLYDFLDGVIPRPDQTYLKLVEMIEVEETEKINKEIANRRSRLGAVFGQVTTEVKREVWNKSPLEELYQNILNWSDDEELRRTIDTKLLQFGYNKLMVLQKEHKLQQRLKVENWARGLVILKYPFELAWRIVIEWKDCESIGDHDINILREYIQFFPESGLGKILKAYLRSEISPFPTVATEDEPEEKPEVPDDTEVDGGNEIAAPDDLLDAMIEGIEKSPNSAMSHRILAEYYLLLEEYETAVEVSRTGKKLVTAESQCSGLALQRNQDALTVSLANALIHYRAPKHHEEARVLFEQVLKHNTTYGAALVGLGLILEEQENFSEASDLLQQALSRDPNNLKIQSEAAWCDVLKGEYEAGKQALEECLERVTGKDPRSNDLKAQLLWRIGSAMWTHDVPSRTDRNGPYSYFIAALQKNQNFAPAYTSLGCFYEDVMGDSMRANKCFQRAFEISAGEIEAAERLARSFAESKEWELVEIVARRVSEAEKKRSIPGKGVSWPQSAIGVVELNNQNYQLAIQSFQAALRSSPNDFHSWIGLGEAYTSSGRYLAALKVFQKAETIDDSNWFAKYMLANVRRELGEFAEACEGYNTVLALRKDEFGVLVALSETLLLMAWKYIETGYYTRAVESAIECLNVTEKIIIQRSDTFNLWKMVGDACMLFSWVQSLAHRIPKEKILQLVENDFESSEFNIMADVDEVGQVALTKLKEGKLDDLTTCVYLGLLAYKRAIYASANDRHAHAVAWFNLGTAEFRAYVTLPGMEMKYRLAAIRCFKRTIKLESGNHEFWNALGVATAELNPKVAQHAIVRALYINDKNARVWTNLGALYALQEDYALANETFSRAQSTDPEYALAWVGQGLIASIFGEPEEAQSLFQHAFEIADQSIVPVKRLFTAATFDTLVNTSKEPALTSVLTPIFAFQKLQAQLPRVPTVLQLSALFDERVGDFKSASEKLNIICSIYEERYEESESDEDLMKYAQSKADLTRMQLGLQLYSDAIDNATMALDLSGDMEKLESCRLSAHLTAGLAYYYSRQMDESIEMFKAALTESEENPDVVCLLSQVLWAKDGEEERDVAREQLFGSIESHPEHVNSVLLLGTIGVMDRSTDVTEAVVDDLRAFRAKENLSREVLGKIESLLASISLLDGGEADATASAASAVFMRPSEVGNWQQLATITDDAFASETALKVAQGTKDQDAEEHSKAHSGLAKIGCDQRAIMLAPWRAEAWKDLHSDIVATVE